VVGFRSRMEEKEGVIKTRLFLFALARRWSQVLLGGGTD